MSNQPGPHDGGMSDDFQFLDSIFSSMPDATSASAAAAAAAAFSSNAGFTLGLSLDHPTEPSLQQQQQQQPHQQQMPVLFPPYAYSSHVPRPNPPPPQVMHGQSMQNTLPQPPPPRPRVRARRGQATDPHSIAERLRRERIAERIRALQDLVPSTNKTDRAVMLDEIVDYVKFLRLQVKVLSMSRLGGAGAVAQLVADIPLSSVEGDAGEGRSSGEIWEKWSTDGTERQVAKLMEEDIGAAMQFLQSKHLCIMPISLAAAIYPTHATNEDAGGVKMEPNTSS